MPIQIHTTGNSAEDEAAHRLARIIREADPQIDLSGEAHVCIVSQVQCYGCTPQDIDLVLLISDRRAHSDQSKLLISSCCVALEIKSHSTAGVRFEGPQCLVRYHGSEHNVSMQSERQKYSLLKYIKDNLRLEAPFVSNLIWLTEVPQSCCPQQATNIVGSDAAWSTFARCISRLMPPERSSSMGSTRQHLGLVSLLTRRLTPSTLDRRRLEAMCQKLSTLDTQYLQRMGEQLLVFRGRGGTGKTVRLLRLAHHLYQERDARVLLLTYNRALAADIQRLLSVLGISDGVGERSIGVRTIYQLMHRWMVTLELLEPQAGDFLERYSALKEQLLQYINEGVLARDELRSARTAQSRDLAWDFLLIDEAQDWPEDERDILYALYGHTQVVVADGVDQLIREAEPTSWREPLGRSGSQVVGLRRSLRLKSALCTVVNALAEELSVPGWDLEPEPSLHGGRLTVLAGVPYSRKLHEQYLSNNKTLGNAPIDMLICVPAERVRTEHDGSHTAEIAASLRAWGFEVWDGTSTSVRGSYPVSLQQHRIVQYESCRGLEGRTVICLGLDALFERKRRERATSSRELPLNDVSLLNALARRWVMIPLTRAIDSMVVQLESPQGELADALRRTHLRYPELVEWIE